VAAAWVTAQVKRGAGPDIFWRAVSGPGDKKVAFVRAFRYVPPHWHSHHQGGRAM